MSTNTVAEQLSKIEDADDATAQHMSEVLLARCAGPGRLEIEAPLTIRLLVPLLRRRPDLCRTPLLDLADSLAIAGQVFDEYSVPAVCDAIRKEVSASIDFWLARITATTDDDDSRSDALRVLSYYDPESQTVRSAATSIVRTISPLTPNWYVAFDAARRILSGTPEWPGLLRALKERMKKEPFAAKPNPPFPRPEEAILVSLLPYEESRVWIYERLNQWPALETMEDVRYLPTAVQVEILSRVVSRCNQENCWVDGGGFYPIYLLLHVVIFQRPGEGEYVAETGKVIYCADPEPSERAALTLEAVTALEPILECRRLWEIETNLLEVFGLPNTRESLAEWIKEAKAAVASSRLSS